MTDLQSNYSTSGFVQPGNAAPLGEQPALLVIDVCRAYLTEGSPLYAKDRFDIALKSTERLITKCRQLKIPVIFTTVKYHNKGSNGGNWYKRMPIPLSSFDEGNPMRDFPPNSVCTPNANETVVEKQYSSSFFGTSLASLLLGMKVDSLIICGYSTSGCVRSTTIDAAQYGFAPYVVRDACGDRHEGPHESNLFDMQAKFGEVVGEDEFMKLVDARK